MSLREPWVSGKGVIVTGAGGGIGAAVAFGFAAAGARVACVDVDGESLDEVVQKLRETGASATGMRYDVSDAAQMAELVPRCLEEIGTITTLVANAGGSRGEVVPFLQMTPGAWRQMIDRNLTSVFVSSQACAQEMAASGGGAIVVMSSQLSVVVRPGMAHYVAAKGAVTQLVKAMAVDLAPHGIRVNAVAPGPTQTPGNAAFFARTEVEEEHRRSIPLGRVARPEEIVGAVMHLASPEASYTTGATLIVDGGYTIV